MRPDDRVIFIETLTTRNSNFITTPKGSKTQAEAQPAYVTYQTRHV